MILAIGDATIDICGDKCYTALYGGNKKHHVKHKAYKIKRNHIPILKRKLTKSHHTDPIRSRSHQTPTQIMKRLIDLEDHDRKEAPKKKRIGLVGRLIITAEEFANHLLNTKIRPVQYI